MEKIKTLASILFSAAILFSSGGSAMAAEIVRLPLGTSVTLRLMETVSSKDAKVGQRVAFSVDADVFVGGVKVIEKGATAIGEVTKASSAGIAGTAGELGISLQMVQAVDGNMVSLSLTKGAAGQSKLATSVAVSLLCCICAIFMKGKDVAFEAGAQYIGFTMNQAEINVR